ncbi:MAG: phosphonate ABC transporter, permease protein PhnE [Burkholderiales bacterium]|nr:phosphonate ABC transporter, permease protein PhnE [Burkholderiales bacterium]
MTKTIVSRADFFAPSLARRLAWVAVLAYLVYAAATLGLTLERVEKGIGYGVRFLAGFFPPSFTETDIVPGMLESVQIALLSSLIGTALAVPIAVLAARNLMPAGVSWAARLVIIFCRSFHPVIVAIVAVKAVGFGALAGIIALTFASIGFVGKLLAEAIEEISKKQIEAVRATGASFMNVFIFGVVPQVMNRFIGFVVYETDSNLRNSTMVGIVGAGGIGGTLFSAFQRFDYEFVAGIILAIIGIVMIGEVLQIYVKRVFR